MQQHDSKGYPDTVAGLGYRFDHGGCQYGQAMEKRVKNLETSISKAIWIVAAAVVASIFSFGTAVMQMLVKGP